MWVWFALERYRANSPAIRWYGGMLSIFGSARIMRATAWRASVRYRNYWSEVVTLQNHLPVSRLCSAEVLFFSVSLLSERSLQLVATRSSQPLRTCIVQRSIR